MSEGVSGRWLVGMCICVCHVSFDYARESIAVSRLSTPRRSALEQSRAAHRPARALIGEGLWLCDVSVYD